jgi:MinD superfamily P-loop ATPase
MSLVRALRAGARGCGPRELVVLSGKGGAGKTSLAASLAVLAAPCVVADCDVDAADLHLVLGGQALERHEFRSGEEAVIDPAGCTACGECLSLCRFDAIRREGGGLRPSTFRVDPLACEGCGVCARFCPAGAIGIRGKACGEWRVSRTRHGPLVDARLAVGAGNSGKLVSTVRQAARGIAEARGCPLVIVDGPPGIGCPAIASVTGASLVLAVAEPTVSGEHDLGRLLVLARHFALPVCLCVNRWDVSPATAERIERRALEAGATVVGRVRSDPAVTRAQMEGRTVVETGAAAAGDVRGVWRRLRAALAGAREGGTDAPERGGASDEPGQPVAGSP